MSPSCHVNIVGAGICGLSVANSIKEEYGDLIDVTITADKFYDETTSYVAGGLWEPHLLSDTPAEKILQWSKHSFRYYQSLYLSSDAGVAGVQQIRVHNLFTEEDYDEQIPLWSNIQGLEFSCPGRTLLEEMGYPPKYTHAHSFNSYVADPKFFLAYLTKTLQRLGVHFEKKRINHIEEQIQLQPQHVGHVHKRRYDVVINCTGLGAFGTDSDSEMFPIRGQVLRVHAPWIKSSCSFGDSYVIPNIDSVVVGGTAQKGNWSTAVSEEDSQLIIAGVCEVFPSLRGAKVLGTFAGLRPCRPEVRLDSEVIHSQPLSLTVTQPQLLVRCYGLGGSGYSIGPGVAYDAVQNHIRPFVRDSLALTKRLSRL